MTEIRNEIDSHSPSDQRGLNRFRDERSGDEKIAAFRHFYACAPPQLVGMIVRIGNVVFHFTIRSDRCLRFDGLAYARTNLGMSIHTL